VKGRGTLALLSALVGLAVAAPSAMATTRVVNDDAIPATCFGFPTTYPDISTALMFSNPGDTILVCPGTYVDFPTVSLANITVKGQFLPPDLASCNATRTDLTTAAAKKKYSVLIGEIFLTADGDKVDSLVVQGMSGVFSYGLLTDGSASGYLIQNNLIEDQSVYSIAFDASGAKASRAFNNCMRDSYAGIGSASLANAGILNNHTFGNSEGIVVGDVLNPPAKVTIQGNVSTNDGYGIEIDGSTTSSVQGNLINGSSAAAICIGFANMGLLVQGNIIKTALAAHGVLVDSCPSSMGSGPNMGIKLNGNVSTSGADGFDVPSDDALQNSKITGNIFKSTGGNAMWIEMTMGNFGNTFTANIATATPGFYGCRDDTVGMGTAGTANFWGDSNIGKPNNFPMTLCFPHK
jgi:hypothetical protein